MSVMPIDNTRLVKLMDRAKKDHNQKRKEDLLEQLKKAQFLSPVSDPESTAQDKGVQREETMEFISIGDIHDNWYLPVFTDWEELYKWKRRETKAIVLSLKDYLPVIQNNKDLHGLVINPFGQNIVINKAILQQLSLAGQESHVMIGVPKKYPDKLVKAVREKLSNIPFVNSAYLLWMARENGEQGYLMILDAPGHEQEAFQTVGKLAKEYLEEGEMMDFLSLESQLSNDAVNGQTPFYSK